MDTERGRYTYLGTPKTTFLMHTLRTNTRVIITATLASTLLLSGLLYASDVPGAALRFVAPGYSLPAKGAWPTQCSPEQFSDGAWEIKSPESYPLEHFLSLYPYNASDPEAEKKVYTPTAEVARDPFAPIGFAGCASGRERTWHLGMHEDGTPDHNDLWEYVVRGASYDWVPRSQSCRVYNEKVEAEDFVTMLVERGGWFFVGDSVTEQHFFSMSCMLYPHVRATPDYSLTGGSGPRDWPQHLYLNPSSPLVTQLKLPSGFDIERTPLVTFRRVDLLFDTHELDSIHRAIHSGSNASTEIPDTLFGPKASESYNLSPKAYLEQFMQPLPEGNYKTLIVSTAGHWTTGSLPGARDPEDIQAGATNPGVYKTFVEAVRVWTNQVSGALLTDKKGRQVLIRAYLPGHEYDCHKEQGPLTEVREFSQEWYNWSWIGRMNEAFKDAIAKKGNSQIKFLGLDRMALLRPDAHALSDCLHIQVGAGIFEGWSRYIWHLGDDMAGLGRSRFGRIRL
ncbi:unnamed protein product [Rhizoctonia solani]|uniref:Uncharacterized protein n=2 Tax=Rhizoctonia solani TaxID=456999 RepID=A0A8H2Y1V1_9AGAM|nr:unnamed protein product [Rhizoctonia solani]